MKAAKNFYNALDKDPEAIIAWCREEIEAYEELIKLIETGIMSNSPCIEHSLSFRNSCAESKNIKDLERCGACGWLVK